MSDSMVTVRIAPEKKEAANRVFERKGITASQAINRFYDYVVMHEALPFEDDAPRRHTPEEIAAAAAWVDNLVMSADVSERFATMTDDEIRQERLIARGLATKEDFE